MPGGGKKATFSTLAYQNHETGRNRTNEQDRQKKFHQTRGKSFELKDSPEKEKNPDGTLKKSKTQQLQQQQQQPGCSKQTDKPPHAKSEKALQKLEQQQIKSGQKAQQKWEKEQQKLEKEQQKLVEKEQHKLEKEQQKLEKEQQKLEKEQQKLEKEQQKLEKEQQKLEKEQQKLDKSSTNCFRGAEKVKGNDTFSLKASTPGKESPVLKSQKSIDISCLKQRSIESPKPPARKSVDLQYTRSLLESTEDLAISSSSSTQLAKTSKK